MGQKVHPTGFRLGILQGWKSNWYTERDYAAYLDEDRAVRAHITRKLSHAGLADIQLRKDATKLRAFINAARAAAPAGYEGTASGPYDWQEDL